MLPVVVALAFVVIVVLASVAIRRRRHDGDDIATFRRQIDALSPDARRPTIDRMKPPSPPSADEDGADGT